MELLREIWISISHNKLRVFISGLSMGWGIYMLIVMLGVGNGVIAASGNTLGMDTVCAIHVTPGIAQLPYEGQPSHRQVDVFPDDIARLKRLLGSDIDAIETISLSQPIDVVYGTNSIKTKMGGISPDYLFYNSMKIVAGRGLCAVDYATSQKVCVISEQTRQALFSNEKDVIGKNLDVGGLPFLVVGVYDAIHDKGSGFVVCIPSSTAQALYCPDGRIDSFIVGATNVKNAETSRLLEARIFQIMASIKHFSQNDRSAVTTENFSVFYLNLINSMSTVLNYTWVVCIAILILSIVSISNIVAVGVVERRNEFGVRLLLGATDTSISAMVMGEAVAIALLFGYAGVVIGFWSLELLDFIQSFVFETTLFSATKIDFSVIGKATIMLIVAGCIAGLMPTWRAVRMKPIDAIR